MIMSFRYSEALKMAKAVCPVCGAQAIENASGGWTFVDAEKCVALKGTKYLDPNQIPTPGVQWCPNLSDAAPEHWSLLPSGYGKQVLDEIARVKASKTE
jgi:hypothetical protein